MQYNYDQLIVIHLRENMDFDIKFEEESSIYKRELDKATDPIYYTLIMHLYIEHLIDRYLNTKFVKDTGILGRHGLGISKKLKLANSFGEIDDQIIDSFNKINDIRNDCAHEFGHEISEKRVIALGRTLGKYYKEILDENKNAYGYAIAPICAFVTGQFLSIVLEAEGYK